jgi:methionine synthase II (cobalamin-independent)
MITGIGSFPFTDIDEAIDIIFSTSPEIPFWPQLPKRSHLENMYTTFLESVPCIVADDINDTVFINTEETKGIEEFYENYYSGNIGAFSISEKVAPGFYRFLERLKDIEGNVAFIKGQLTGPFSMGLGLKDEKGKPIIYNYGFFDIIKKALNMKAKWMVNTIKTIYPEKDLIIFFDEPYMVSFGSAYVSISKEETILLLNDTLEGIDAKIGVHCCGNTDWSVLFGANVNIVNYDAYNFLETIFYFKYDFVGFLKRGGWISPGFVPSSEEVLNISKKDITRLMKRFEELMKEIGQTSESKNWLLTTSCGLGSLSVPEAKKAMELLKELST